MSTYCIEKAIRHDDHFAGLTNSLKGALFVVLMKFDDNGDAELTDYEMRKNVLGPKRWLQFAEMLTGWGWLARAANGNLVRAGILAPAKEEETHANTQASDRMYLSRQFQRLEARIEQRIGEVLGGKPAEQKRTQDLEKVNISEPNVQKTPSRTRASDSDSESDQNQTPPIYIYKNKGESESDSESDQNQTREENQPQGKAFDELRKNKFPPDVISETASRMAARGVQTYKVRYAVQTAKAIQREREEGQQAITLLSVKNGKAPAVKEKTWRDRIGTLEETLEDLAEKNYEWIVSQRKSATAEGASQ